MAHIRNETEGDTTTLHLIAHIVGTVVRNTKWSDTKLTQHEGHTFLYDMHIGTIDLLANTIVVLNATMHLTSCINRQVIIIA